MNPITVTDRHRNIFEQFTNGKSLSQIAADEKISYTYVTCIVGAVFKERQEKRKSLVSNQQ